MHKGASLNPFGNVNRFDHYDVFMRMLFHILFVWFQMLRQCGIYQWNNVRLRNVDAQYASNVMNESRDS